MLKNFSKVTKIFDSLHN